jgi:CubicO group peptidase (beta-lactamase class C family)
MKRLLTPLAALALLLPAPVAAQQEDTYDYWKFNREMIQRGQQAIFMCNGLFTSNRTLDQIFAQELAYLRSPIGTPQGGDYVVDRERRAVAVGADGYVPTMRAAFREGIGCVVMAPDQTFDDIADLPVLDVPPPPGDPATIPWPDGDLIRDASPPPGVDRAALAAASDWAFDRESREQVTLSLMVVHGGRVVHERYAPGVDATTRTRTWSTAKSIAVTLFGILADQGKLRLDEPIGLEWLPRAAAVEGDPRNAITLRHLLNMSSGLATVDNQGLEYATGSGLAYWAGASSVRGALSRAMIREPGTSWDYENYDTLLGVLAMKRAIGDDRAYLEFPRRALLDKIGMRNTLLSTDRFGDFILSSQVYTNARDLARFGLVPERGRVERRADPLGGVDRFRADTRARHCRTGQPVRRSVVARARRPDRRPRRRILHRRKSWTVRGGGAVARRGDRAQGARLRPAGLRPLGPDPRGAQGDPDDHGREVGRGRTAAVAVDAADGPPLELDPFHERDSDRVDGYGSGRSRSSSSTPPRMSVTSEMMRLPSTAAQNPLTARCSVRRAVIRSTAAFTTNAKRPRVMMRMGRESTRRIGFSNAFNRPNRSATHRI